LKKLERLKLKDFFYSKVEQKIMATQPINEIHYPVSAPGENVIINQKSMAFFMEPVQSEQVFSRTALGFLWAKRDQLDPSQRAILDALYMGRKKGSIDGYLKVEYRLPKTGVGKLGFGRCYGTKGSLETLERECRGTMCHEFYDDVDVVNCHPVLLVQLAHRNYGVDLTEVEKYCDNRNEYLARISSARDEAKQAIIKVFYNGKNEHPFLVPMITEIRNFIKKYLMEDKAYSELLAYVKKQDANTYGSFLSHILQTEERKVMMSMRQAFINQGRSVDVLAYDGVMIRKGKKALDSVVLREVEDFIFEHTTYKVALVIKPFECFEISEVQKEETEEVAPKVLRQDYERTKAMFEESHFYFSTTNQIVSISADGTLRYETIEHATIKYIAFDFKHSNNLLEKTSFIKLWLNDPNRRTIHTIDMRPSEDVGVFSPPLVFRYTTFSKANNPKAIEMFNELIGVLTSHMEPIKQYVLSWLAHMIQKPFDNPGTAIIFTGAKGCGKDTLGDFIVDWLLGHILAHNYDSTEQYWEKHDTDRENRLFIKLEEASGALNRQHVGAMKARITSASLTVNPKGEKSRTTGNYNHTMMTSNDGQPVKPEEGERRFEITACSPEWVGNHKKWEEVRSLLFCEEGASTIGHYLTKLDISAFNPRKLPENEYLQMAIDAEISPERAFIDQWDGENLTMDVLYNLYERFCMENRMKFASSSSTFGLRLMEHVRDGRILKKRTTKGMIYSKPADV